MRLLAAVLLCAAGLQAAGELMEAVQRGDAAAVKGLLGRGADARAGDPDGTTPLHYAAHRGDVATAEALLRAGAAAGAVNRYGSTPLLEAAAAGNARLVKLLLDAGASANTANPEGETPLMAAAKAGSAEAVAELIARGAQVNAREKWKGQTALMWAAAANRAAAAKVLIDRGADVNARSAAVTPEKPYPANGNLVSVQPKGAYTALLFAAREGAIDVIRLLLARGAKIDAADPDNITPLVMAIINGHYDAAGVLLDGGANPNLADAWGRAAVYAAIDMHTLEPSTTRPAPKEVNRLTGLDVARMALERGANANARLVKELPGRGIPDLPDGILKAGATPFIRAAKTGDVAAMKLLLKHGADAKAVTENGVNALMAAAGQGWRFGDSEIHEDDALEGVKYCIELGLDVNAVNAKKETALHGAADRGADRIVAYLVAHGARIDVRDEKDKTPIDLAMGGEVRGHPGYPSTEKLLRQLAAGASQ